MSDYPKKTKFLGPDEIERSIAEVAAASEAEGIEVALIGGAALQLYGSDRLTKDVDFVARKPLAAVKVKSELNFGGVRGESPSGVPTDIVVRSDVLAALYDEALDDAVDMGILVKVARPEHLAAMKMGARRGKDKEDLRTLVKLGVLDFAKTQDLVRRHLGPYAEWEFIEFVETVLWRKSSGKED